MPRNYTKAAGGRTRSLKSTFTRNIKNPLYRISDEEAAVKHKLIKFDVLWVEEVEGRCHIIEEEWSVISNLVQSVTAFYITSCEDGIRSLKKWPEMPHPPPFTYEMNLPYTMIKFPIRVAVLDYSFVQVDSVTEEECNERILEQLWD